MSLNAFRNEIKNFKNQYFYEAQLPDIQISDDYYLTQTQNSRFYVPSPTGLEFHKDDSFFKVIMGPFGSGKSVACCHEIIFRAFGMPKCIDGIRRSKWCVVRNTYRMLEISTVRTWLDWFAHLGEVKITQKPPYYFCEFWDDQGKIELEIVFLALDRPGQLESLKSAEFTGAWLNELSGLQEAVFQFMKGRINGRYPSKSICTEPYWTGIIADTNPPNTRSWVYRMFEKEKHPEFRMFRQPRGLIKNSNDQWIDNVDADNKKNLAPDYYQKMTLGASEEFIKVFCLGEYGSVLDGKPVYAEYNDDIHSINGLKPIPENYIYTGWDFGLTPACVVAQRNVNGRIHILKEYVSQNMDLEQFIKTIVKPRLAVDFKDCIVHEGWADPAGTQKAQTDGSTCLAILNKYGFNVSPAPSQDPIVRQKAVHDYLNLMIDGKPALIVNRDGCQLLREGFQGGYQYRKLHTIQGEKFADFVEKNEYSHPHDALQYLMLGISGYIPEKERTQVIYFDEF
jgi:hypothetical protein